MLLGMDDTEKQRYEKVLEATRKLFGNKHDAISWLRESSVPLDNVTPQSLLATEDGFALVLYEIGQMEFGHPV